MASLKKRGIFFLIFWRYFTSLKLTDNTILSANGSSILFENANSTVCNLLSTQTLSNKTLSFPIINNASLNSVSIDTNSTAITQINTDNSTKIATTAFVKQFSAYNVFKNTNITTSPYVFNFGPGGYLEFYIDSNSVYIRTKSTYLSSVQISYSAPYCYSVAGTFFG